MKMLKTITRHAAIILALFYAVLFVIDRINNAMEFLNNDITKALGLLLAAVSIFNAVASIAEDRARAARALRKKRKKRNG